MRYQILIDTPSGDGRYAFTRSDYRQFAQRPAAKRFAESVAWDHHFGVSILDTRTNTIDCGDEVIPVDENVHIW